MCKGLVFPAKKRVARTMEQIDLKQIERNIFRDYFQDGLVDIIFGAYFLILGLLLAGVFMGLGLNVRLVRYYVVAAVALVSGPTSALLPLAGKLANIGLFIAAVGAVTLVWGLLAFVCFLRKYPHLAEKGVDVTN
jgi:hypothetical protein